MELLLPDEMTSVFFAQGVSVQSPDQAIVTSHDSLASLYAAASWDGMSPLLAGHCILLELQPTVLTNLVTALGGRNAQGAVQTMFALVDHYFRPLGICAFVFRVIEAS